MHQIKIDKELRWLRRYISALRHKKWLKLNKIKDIRSYKLPLNRSEYQLASCLHHGSKNNYTIMLRMATHIEDIKNVKKNGKHIYKIVKNIGYQDIAYTDILHDLAHEIAHTVEWEHTVQHEILTIKIYLTFLNLLKKDVARGIVDEKDI